MIDEIQDQVDTTKADFIRIDRLGSTVDAISEHGSEIDKDTAGSEGSTRWRGRESTGAGRAGSLHEGNWALMRQPRIKVTQEGRGCRGRPPDLDY